MADYQSALRKLAVRDQAYVEQVGIDRPHSVVGKPDRPTRALIRLAALIASGGEQPSYQDAVERAILDGASPDDVVGTLIAVAPMTGIDRVVAAAPKVGLALGYDVDEALTVRDSD
jgi:alkylhydroperoxidase/carboxymuconolactone decarboxylase family protein YurZ